MGKMANTGTQKSKSTSTSAPPSWSLQNHQTAAKGALDAYNKGYGQQVYQGKRVAGLDRLTSQGIDQVGQNAQHFSGYLEGLNKKYGGQPSYQEQNLGEIAAQNPAVLSPAFQQGIQNQLNYARDKGAAQQSALGMQGGSSAAAAQARALGQVAGDLGAQQYNTQIAQKLAASGAMEQGAAQRNALMYNANAQGNAMQDAAIRAGQIRQAQEQAQLDADRGKFQETQDAPWRGLALLNQATNAADNGYGTTTSSSTTSGRISPMQQMMGFGSMGLGGLSGFGKAGGGFTNKLLGFGSGVAGSNGALKLAGFGL